MSAKKHVNPRTGEVSTCGAQNPASCPFTAESAAMGWDTGVHFDNEAEAHAAYENFKKSETFKTLKKDPKEAARERRQRIKDSLVTVVPEAVYENKLVTVKNSDIKVGDDLSNGDDVELSVIEAKAGYKNITLKIVNPATEKTKSISLPLHGESKVYRKIETDASKEERKKFEVEQNLEYSVKSYQSDREKVIDELKSTVDKGYRINYYEIEKLVNAEAKDRVMGGFIHYAELVNNKAELKTDTPYTYAFEEYRESLQKEINSQASRGNSISTSGMSNLYDNAELAAKADFLRDRYGYLFF